MQYGVNRGGGHHDTYDAITIHQRYRQTDRQTDVIRRHDRSIAIAWSGKNAEAEYSTYLNVCDQQSPTSQTDGQTDAKRRHDRSIAKAWSGKKKCTNKHTGPTHLCASSHSSF